VLPWLALLLLAPATAGAATATFQQGVSGYASTQDTELRSGEPDTQLGSQTDLSVDLGDPPTGIQQVLIRFDNLFGAGAGQIPVGSVIHSATLRVTVTGGTSGAAQITLNRMLVTWSEASTWNTMVNGVQMDGTDASATVDATIANPTATGNQTWSGANLTATVQAWCNGTATNYGWVIASNVTNNWDFHSSETSTSGNRPLLTIDYTPPADLAISKTDAPDPAPTDGSLVYTLVVTNNGPGTATGVTVLDTLPAGVTFVSATPSQGSCSGTSIVNCNLGAISASGTASVEILVTTGGAGSLTNRAHVSGGEPDLVTANNTDSEGTTVVASSTSDIPLTQYRRIHGFVDYTTTGGSLRTQPNSVNPCAVGASSTGALAGIPVTATIHTAYLYWAGSGATVDNAITLDGAPLTADRTWQSSITVAPTTYDFFSCMKDVTAQVAAKRNGNYTFGGLTVATGNPYCSNQTVLAGWSMMVVYEDASLSGKTLVLYDGLDIERNGSTSYLLTGIWAATPPEAKTTYLVWEGDETLSGANERYEFNATALSDAINPSNNVYNGTINAIPSSTTYGVDCDTYDVSAYVPAGSTLATATLRTGPDLTLLNAVVLQVKSNVIVGTVFEDVNYGGGAGRDLATAVAAAPTFSVRRPNATVELYNDVGTFLRTTTTDASGVYGFAGLAAGNYQVRVVNQTVTSCRTGATGTEWPVQTFRTDGSGGTPTPVTDRVGGANPSAQDSPANTGAQNLGALTAQSVAPAQIAAGVAVVGADFGYSFDVVVNRNDSGQGSLRQFLLNANALANTSLAQQARRSGADNAVFMLADGTARPGLSASYASQFVGGIATISPTSAFVAITDPVAIDATTQPGYAGTPVIELDGSAAGAGADGLRITAGTSSVRGFTINDFDGSAIELATAGGDTVQACWLGLNAAGTAAAPNNEGIYVNATANHAIGGTSVAERNVISGNDARGILLSGAGASGNLIQGNFIGLRPSGLAAVAQPIGVEVNDAPSNTVGGVAAGARNVISGQSQSGVYVTGAGAVGNFVQGNWIGVDSTGTGSLANGTRGIEIAGGSGTTVGGGIAGAGNAVANNGGPGILVSGGTGHIVSRNSTYANAGLGVDLGAVGVTLNDAGDGDGGANDLYNYPVILDATRTASTLTVRGFSRPGAVIEVFESDNDPTGFGEGRTWLFTATEGGGSDADAGTGAYGPAVVNGVAQGTDIANRFSFSVPLPGGITDGSRLTATATDGSNNTSEFGGPVIVQSITVVKRAFRADGTPLASGATAPKGSIVRFLLYVNNRGDAVSDASIQDALDPGFEYLPGTLRVDNSLAACPGDACDTAEEAAIYAAVAAQAPRTDAVDGDVASYSAAPRRVDAGNVNVANAQLNLDANRVWAMLIDVRVR
jgi:uncharacterized repeat protein (TIGR01451 family)